MTTYTPRLHEKQNDKGIEPFYQGQLDVFCAIYAVLNALRITHNINAVLARNIFHQALAELARKPELFCAVLNQKTDYIFLVDSVLAASAQIFPINIKKPFTQISSIVCNQRIYDACYTWLGSGLNRAVILRYQQYIPTRKQPINKHWTTINIVENDILHFFDCSHKRTTLQQIQLSKYTTELDNINADCLLYIDPHSLRFIEFSS